MNKIPNIEFKKTKRNPTLDSDTSLFELPFYKDVEYFTNLDNFVTFVNAVERLVRSSKYYSRYIKYIKEEVGLNFCQVLSNIKVTDENDVTEIEMHHGPILTLFDYVSIVVDHLLYHDKKINTFIVADIILKEHYKNNIQIVMLTKTAHEQVHLDNVFLSTKHAFGDLNRFLTKYKDGISQEQITKINEYISLCEKYDSYDKGVFELNKILKNWSKNN